MTNEEKQLEDGNIAALNKVRENRANALAALDKALPSLKEGDVKKAVEHCHVAIESTSLLLDMVTVDIINIIRNLQQMSDVVIKSGVTTEVLLETLVNKEIITAEDYKTTFENLKLQAQAAKSNS